MQTGIILIKIKIKNNPSDLKRCLCKLNLRINTNNLNNVLFSQCMSVAFIVKVLPEVAVVVDAGCSAVTHS